MLPLTFLLGGLSCGLFYFITNPSGVFSYFVWCFFNLCFMFQIVSLETYFSKNVPKEVRGMMYGYLFMSGQIGRTVCYKVGAVLFKVSNYWPFLFVGICWVAVSMVVTVLFSLGIYEKKLSKARTSILI